MGLVRVVRVDGDDELVPPLRPPHSQLIADTVGGLVPAFPQEKFSVYRGRVTFIGTDIFSFLRLDRILSVVGTVFYGLCNRETRCCLSLHQAGGCYGPSLLSIGTSGQVGPNIAKKEHSCKCSSNYF